MRHTFRKHNALVDANTGAANFLNPETWDALTLCDGTVDFSLPIIPENLRNIAADAFAKGIIEPCAPGQALTTKSWTS